MILDFIFLLFIIFHATNGLTLPPPKISAAIEASDKLLFSIAPPKAVSGITGYEIVRTRSLFRTPETLKVTIQSAEEFPVRSKYKATNCKDGDTTSGGSMCCTNSEQIGNYYKFTVDTATYFDNVKIFKPSATQYHDQLVNFDMKFQDENNVWHDCPGTPYNFPQADGIGPKTFDCKSPVKAKVLQIIQRDTNNMCLAEVEIYTPESKSYSIGPVLVHSINEANIGKRQSHFYAATCNSIGCGSLSTEPLTLKYPDKPSAVSVSIEDDDTITYTMQPPSNNGGFDVIGYNIFIQDSSSSTDPTCTDATWDVDLSGTKTVTSTGIGLIAKKSYVWSLTDLGCSTEYVTFVNSLPDEPFSATLIVVDLDTLSLVVQPPKMTGGKTISKYEVISEGTGIEIPTADYSCTGSSKTDSTTKGEDACDGNTATYLKTNPNANEWLKVNFPANKVRSVKISAYQFLDKTYGLVDFSLEWLAEDGTTYHACPGPASYTFESTGDNSNQYACDTGTYQAKGIRITQSTSDNLQLTEVEVFAAESVVLEVSVNDAAGPSSGSKSLTGTGIGASPATRDVKACNAYGCSLTALTVLTGVPSPPTSVAIKIKDANTVTATLGSPGSDGGSAVTGYKYMKLKSAPVLATSIDGGHNENVDNCYDGSDGAPHCGSDMQAEPSLRFFVDTCTVESVTIAAPRCSDWNQCDSNNAQWQLDITPGLLTLQYQSQVNGELKWQDCPSSPILLGHEETVSFKCKRSSVTGIRVIKDLAARNAYYGQNKALDQLVLAEVTINAFLVNSDINLSGGGDITGSNYGTLAKSWYFVACNVFGCSEEFATGLTSTPDPPSKFSLRRKSDTELSFEFAQPTNNGGADVTKYTIGFPARGSKVVISDGSMHPRARSGQDADKCYDSGDFCATCSIKKTSVYCLGQLSLRLNFAPSRLFGVEITNYNPYDDLGDFNLRWKGEDNNWNACPGSPYFFNEGGPKEFSCITGSLKAVSIEISKVDSITVSASLHLANVDIFELGFNKIQDVALNAMTGTITGAGFGTVSQVFLGQSCSAIGCGEYGVVDMRAPDVQNATGSVKVVSNEKLAFTLPELPNDGGATVTGYELYDTWPKAINPVTITGGEFKSGASGAYSVSSVNYPLNVIQYCLDSSSSNVYCESKSASQEWIRLRFASNFVHSVTIETSIDAFIGVFNLRYKGAVDQEWHICPGSPYTHPNVADVIEYACESNEKAIAIELQQQNNKRLKLDVIAVYSVNVPASIALDANMEITGTDLGSTEKEYRVVPTNNYGESDTVFKLSVGKPIEAANEFNVGVAGPNALTLVVEPPTNSGGKDVTNFVATIVPLFEKVETVLQYVEIRSGTCSDLPDGDFIADADMCETASDQVYDTTYWYGTYTGTDSPQGCFFENDPGYEFTYFKTGQSSYSNASINTPQLCVTCPDGSFYDAATRKCRKKGIKVEFSRMLGEQETRFTASVPNISTTEVSVAIEACNSFGCSPSAYSTNVGPCEKGVLQVNEICWLETDCDAGKYLNGSFCISMTTTTCTAGNSYYSASATKPDFRGSTSDDAKCVPCDAGKSKQSAGIESCEDCTVGKYSNNGAGVCEDCPKGYYVESVGNSACKECVAGKYNGLAGQVKESDCLICDGGYYANQTASEKCYACPKGRTLKDDAQTATEHDSFNDCKACSVRKYNPFEGSKYDCLDCHKVNVSGSGECPDGSCDPGSFMNAASELCELCPEGQYTNDRGLSACYDCPAGQYSEERQNRKCKSCGRGKYGTEKGSVDETNGCIDCPAGRFSDNDGLDESNNVGKKCTGCPGGKYSTETGQAKESLCKDCAAGLYGDDSTGANSADICETCRAGMYSESVGAKSNASCTNCPSGFSQKDLGRAYCLPCIPGRRQHSSGSTSCTECVAGHASPTSRETSRTCPQCEAGEYQPEKGQVSCLNCAAGRISEVRGSTECTVCSKGEMRSPTDDATKCTECKAGEYQEEEGRAFCMPCVPGTFSSKSGSEKCGKCPINYFSENKKATSCKKCDIGSSTNDKDSSSACYSCDAGKYGEECDKCEPGQYRKGDDKVSRHCSLCEVGYYQSGEGEASCLPCVPGKYLNETGFTKCKDCAVNKFSKNTSSTSCLDCDTGEFSTTGSTAW